MKARNIIIAFFFICACLNAPLWADAYNNSIELRNDSQGSQYFHYRYRESYEKDPAAYYLQSRDPDSWIMKTDGSYHAGGSCNALIWGIKAEYDTVDGVVEKTGYPYFEGKNIPPGIELHPDFFKIVTRDMDGFPADYNVSRAFGNHQQDWDFLVAKKDSILDSAALTDDSPDWDKALAMAWHCYKVRTRLLSSDGQGFNLHPVDYLINTDYCVGASNAFVGLCAVMGIPARTLRTWEHQWAEAFIDGKWRHCENSVLDSAKSHRGFLGGWRIPADQEQGPLFSYSFAEMLVNPPDGVSYYQSHDMWIRYDLDACPYWRMYMAGGGGVRAQYTVEKPQIVTSLLSAQEIGLLYSGTVTTVRVAKGEKGMWLNPPMHGIRRWKAWRAGRVDQANGIRQRFYLSDTSGLTELKSYLVIDSANAFDMPADGGDWYYSVNGHRYYLRDHGGWSLEPHPFSSQDTAGTKGARCLVFSIPPEDLITEMNTPLVPRKAVSSISAGRISMRSSASTIVFDLPFSGVQRATVHSLNGRVLAHAAIENNFLRIPRSVLSSGTCVLSVHGTQGMQTLRFAIQ